MKIRLTVFFIVLFFGFKFYGQEFGSNLHEVLTGNILDMWTKIDIVRAINTDCPQKKIFLEDLISDSFDTYYLARKIKQEQGFLDFIYAHDIVNLILSVRSCFEEVFHPIKDSDHYAFCLVLQKIINVLKIPENIETKPAS